MKFSPARVLVATVVLTSLVIPMLNGADSPPPETRWNNADRAEIPGLVHGSFQSQSMEREIGYNVFLPPGYNDGTARYPVMYFLHGAGGNENSDAGAFSGLVAKLIVEKKISPVICVFPNGGNRSGYRDDPDTKIMVETAIVKELLPLIDQTYRTRPDRASRVVVGFSMGGAGAFRFAIKYPELFGAAGSWGGAFGGGDNHELPADFAVEALRAVADRIRVLLVVGAQDFTLASYPPLLRNLAESKFPCGFEILSKVEHNPGAYYTHNGETMLSFLTTDFEARSE